MGRKYEDPTLYRDKECPYCGLYFTSRGLNRRLRFKHPNGDFLDPITIEKMKILNQINTEEGLKKALRMFLIEYLTKGL